MLACQLCTSIFLNYGSYLCHVCYGPPTSGSASACASKARFGCRACGKQDITTFLDFQSHLRRSHNICEICMTVGNAYIITLLDR